jgi:uncharacterized protein YifN (PemK superfamily)
MIHYRLGQIVYAPIHDGKNSIKVRPVVINDNEPDEDDEIMVVAISTRRQSPCPYYYIQVHNDNKRDIDTGLSQPSWAKCNFVRFPKLSRNRYVAGDMPVKLLERILNVHDRIANMGDRFRDWQ